MSEQAAFTQALLDPELPCPAGLTTWNGSDPTLRFAVYRNNVVVSLVDALADTFPVVQQLVGVEFFRAMARLFVQAQPPRTRTMVWYGAGFADFVQGFGPAASLPYLADVARLEMARVRSYHAADAVAVPPEALQAVLADPQRLQLLHLQLHPALQVVASGYAVFSLWAAHQGALQIADVDPYQAQTALVLRQALDVETLPVSPATGQCLAALQRGDSLLDAASADPALDLPATLAYLVRHQLITRIYFGEADHDTLADPARCPG